MKKRSVDGITMDILQKAFDVIVDIFLQINMGIKYDTFPKNWDKSTVISIENKSNTNSCE